jgi:hypothetical protein
MKQEIASLQGHWSFFKRFPCIFTVLSVDFPRLGRLLRVVGGKQAQLELLFSLGRSDQSLTKSGSEAVQPAVRSSVKMPARHNTGPVETRLARSLSASGAASLADSKFATYLDQNDKLADLRAQFSIPNKRTVCASTPGDGAAPPTGTGDGEQESVYLAGNSLGLMPKRTPELLSQELQVWSTR